MNNIYKVIWSKAKNCYVVASEIARSHTKSASGSEKIGGGTRRKLLASLMALSLLCGGLGVAEAAVVHVDEVPGGTKTVYTTEDTYTRTDIDGKLDLKANAADVNNELAKKADAANVYSRTEADSKLDLKANAADVNNELAKKADAANVYSRTEADSKLDLKANAADVNNELAKKADAANVYSRTEADSKLDLKANAVDVNNELAKKADKTYVDNAVANVNTKLADYAKTTDVYDKGTVDGKITAEETARKAADAALDTRLTTAEGKIGDNKTAIDALKAKDTALEGEITRLDGSGVKYDTAVKDTITLKGPDGTKITHLKDATLSDSSTDAVTGRQLNKTNENLAAETAARENKDNELDGKITTLDGKVTTDINELKAKDTDLANKIQTNAADIQTNKNAIAATDKRTGGITRNDAATETKIEGNVTVDNLGNVTAKGNVTADGKLKGDGVDAGTGDITTDGAVNAGSLKVENDSKLKGDVTMDKKLSVTGDTSLGKTDVGGALNVTGESNLQGNVILGKNTANTVTVNGKSDFKEAVEMDNGLTVTSGDTTLKGKLTVTDDAELKNTTVDGTLGVTGATTLEGTLTAEKDATFEKDVTVKGTTNLKDTTVKGDLNVTGTITTDKMVFGDKVANNYTEIDHGKVTSKNVENNGAGQLISSSSIFNAEENKVGFANNATGDQSFHKQTSDIIMDNVKDRENSNNRTQTKTETKDIITDKDGNSSTTSQTASENKTYLKDKDGKNTNSTIDTAKGYDKTIQGENGKTSTTQDELNITNTAKDGTITNDAKDIVNKATTMTTTVTGQATESYGGLDTTVTGAENHTVTGKQTNTVKGGQENIISGGQTNTITGGQINNITGDQINNITGDQTTTITGNKTETVTENVTEDYKKDLTTTVGGNETHEVKGTKTETVEGKVTENFKNGQATNVTGDQDIHVTGKQTNTVEGGQENIISGGQTNTITGGQINNITGDQTTTITGNKTETVTENVTEDYKKDLTTTVGGNETHEVKGTKTETVEGKVTENFKNGQATNVTGDQVIKVSGTQTTTATDINRNASSGMIDTIDNDYGTNTETKVAGKTTTDVSIKGTGEKGQYIRGANESRDYLIKGTLKNSETKTVEKTSTEITDGNGNTSSTIQDKTQISGSVTNGTSSAVSNVKADSIDTAVIEGTNTSLISQKKDSITSAVGNGATSTVIQQGDKDITIASNGGTVGIVGKDIINNATNEITNTAGTKITDQVGSNTRVIDQTSITDTVGTANRKIEDGKITDTAGDFTVTTDKANGTTFTNAGSTASSFTTFNGTDTGSARGSTNIKGNEISTGKVEANYAKMDYADVMRDLGVHGNANIAGTTTTKTLNVTENATVGGTLEVTKKATFHNDVDIAKNLSVGEAVTAKSYKVGDKTYIDANGINANDQKITNVADGSISEGSKDAVNGGQLYGVKRDLEHQVDKVGANAAAMANLRPMEFDPSSKWNIAAAIGNYGSETAAALGAFYRPNDDVMVNLSTAFGTGENMVGGGVSVRLGKGGNKLSREETNALKAQVADLTARMDALLSVLNPNMSKDFPDVPENHWAYEAVSRLAGNDIVQGYPDGEFHGERTMTRYEMAEIIYNALSRGAEAEKELVEEFKPELQAMAASEKATAEKAEG